MLKKIVFMGTPEFAVPSLEVLNDSNYEISAVYSQPASKANRGQKLAESKIEILAKKFSLNIRTPKILDSDVEYNFLKSIQPDIVIVAAYGKIIPKRFLSIPKYGFVNVHASLLPKWRGAAPIQRSIMNRDKESGISIMKINENLDEGPVCNQYSLKISEKMNAEELSEKLSLIASEKILDILDNVFDDNLEFKDQDHSKATYAKKIQKLEGKIDWNENVDKIIGKINGLYPYPGAFFSFNGERYKILKAEKSSTTGKPGDIVSENFEVCCGEGSIKVLSIQREGKRVQQINEFLLGTQIKKGFNIA